MNYSIEQGKHPDDPPNAIYRLSPQILRVTRTSPLTGRAATMDLNITEAQWMKWRQGELIQDAFANLSSDEREFILTGYVAEDWLEIFKEER